MQLYAITLEATTQHTITLAANSIAEAEATARDCWEDFCERYPKDASELHMVEAAAIEEASK